MSENKYRRFGKYLILDHLVDGGMAKICRASYLGEQANKIVAIKMVQPQYSKNASFVQMFEDELKVTFSLLHPNIAQMYDYGLVDEQLYCAMEYVDGANLKQYLDRLKQMKFVFPVEISTYIISQVCQALHYAHTFTDKLTGKPFNIIHRDISPHNIMLTYDGAVKVIDFGIAKADSNSEATQAGTIKGKLSYIAPEYLDGMELDHRYDQFAVGITLWEMLCSRKLFTAKNDLAVLKLIQGCKVPKPSSINPNVPAELDEIVIKSLSKDRGQRFENMDKLNRALVKFLYSNYPDFNATDLSYFARQLFKKEIERDKKKFVEFGKVDIRPYLEEIKQSETNNQSKAQQDKTQKRVREPENGVKQGRDKTGKIEIDLGTFDKKTETSLDLDFADSTSANNKLKAAFDQQNSLTSRDRSIGGKKIIHKKQTTRTRVKNSAGTEKLKKTTLSQSSDKTVSSNVFPTAIAAGVVLFVVFNLDFVSNFIGVDLGRFTGGKKKNISENDYDSEVKENQLREKNRVPGSDKGSLTLYDFRAGMMLYLNGEEAELDGLDVELEIGKTYALAVGKPGYKKWRYPKVIKLTPDNKSLTITVPDLDKDVVGYLTTSENFSPGSKIRFKVHGEVFEKSLPLKNERIPAGEYNAVITNKLLGTERKVQFEIKENKRNFLK